MARWEGEATPDNWWDRVDHYRQHLILASDGGMTVSQADQRQAAADEATRLHATQIIPAVTGTLTDPTVVEISPDEFTPSDQVRVWSMIQATFDWVQFCPHLRTAIQPMLIRLPASAADCLKCARTRRNPVLPDGVCDLCRNPRELFRPVTMQIGPVIVAGDICPACYAEFPMEGGGGG